MLNARKFLANYTILVAGDLVSRLLAFWAMVHIAGVLGKDLFGTLGFATAFTAYFELISRQGLDIYGIQAVARQPSLARRYADTLFGLRLTSSAVAFLVLSVTARCLAKPEELKLLIILSGLMFFSGAFSPQWVFQAVAEMKFAAAARILATLVFAFLVLSLLKRPGEYFHVPLFQFGSEVVAVLWLLLVFGKRYGLPRPSFDFIEWGKVLRESLPMGLEGAFGVVLFNFDMVMLGFWRPASEVGEYNAAYKFINFASAFIFLYAANLLPLISRSRGDPGELRRVSDRLFKYTLLLALPLTAGGSVLAQDLINLIFGRQFSEAAVAMRILIWIIPLMTCRVVFRNTLMCHGFQRNLLWCTFFGAAINAVLNLLLIPHYTYVGSAAAMVITEVIFLLLLYHQAARRVVRLPFARHVWRPALACVPMVLLVVCCPAANLLARIGSGALLYFLAAWMFRAFSIREIWEITGQKALN